MDSDLDIENFPSCQYEFPSSPAKFGSGTWFSIHTLAAIADSRVNFSSRNTSSQKEFCQMIRHLISRFPYSKCRNNALLYISEHPPELYIGRVDENGISIGMFLWSWEFHNCVNRRLKKCEVHWKTAKSLFSVSI
jgi:hypothetical protein